MRAYASETDALTDVLRLSQAMSYKAAIANVPVGGAKSVILADPTSEKSDALLRAMGRFINLFGGAYVSAPDAGIGIDDLRVMRLETRWILGTGEVTGPSALYTALGVFESIRTSVRYCLNRESLANINVAIQGLGSVGAQLALLLHQAGARLVVADIDQGVTQTVHNELGADVVAPEVILFQDVDVVSPCAFGGILNDETIPEIRARIVCGAANNQLAENRHAQMLYDRNILYAPDYVVNAGGMIAGVAELDERDPSEITASVTTIGQTLAGILKAAELARVPPYAMAERFACAKINSWRSEQHDIT